MSEKGVKEKSKEDLQEANYRLNRLMSKLGVSSDDDVSRYEKACHEVGRLQGLEECLVIIRSITES